MNRRLVSNFFVFLLIFVTTTIHATELRHYEVPPTDEERETVFFVVNTLGNKSLPKVWKSKSSLKKAGEKIEHIHPLRFLEIVFTDEELKASIRNLRNRDLIWSEFKGGLFGSLTEEAKRHNLTAEQLQDFGVNIGIDVNIVYPSILKGDWDEMLSLLMKHVPREGDPGRYDM